jgi:BirA family biotin operon repressor/biotin-[acetyl-CoA-carboxylase] ligase
LEGALVEKGLHTLAGGELAGLVLTGDGTLVTGVEGLLAQNPELLYARLGAQVSSVSSQSDSHEDEMATPYRQVRLDLAPSTQDVARDLLDDLPVLVIAAAQTSGRGRAGSEWASAPRALATSLAVRIDSEDHRPLSLMAGVAAARSTSGVVLKWPNDLLMGGDKVGGILVESSEGLAVIGLGVNLWWPGAPSGAAALFADDPGPDRHLELGGLWGAEMMRLIDGEGWPIEEYRSRCDTLGRRLTWEPEGAGQAVDLASDGGLVVETPEGRLTIHSGAVRHVR